MERFDCAVIGAGPAGLSASLVLGRSRRKIAVFDNGKNRNRVTQESHGFITRDGIKPGDFKKLGLTEIQNYPSVQFFAKSISAITKQPNGWFTIMTSEKEVYTAEKLVLATGIQEHFPAIPDIKKYYGKSLFSCPYCDGWELKDQPLIVIAENEDHAFHMGKLVYNWSENVVIATNGFEVSHSIISEFQKKNIMIRTEPIKNLYGESGYLKKVEFASGEEIERTGGFLVPSFKRPNPFAEQLGCDIDENGAIMADDLGRTSQKNIYTAGETAKAGPSSLIISAAEGSKAATAVNMDLTNERF
jgi:thioredoxin reductase